MSLATDILKIAGEVARNEKVIEQIGAPLVEVISEALSSGLTHGTLIDAIKREMTAASDLQMKAELEKL